MQREKDKLMEIKNQCRDVNKAMARSICALAKFLDAFNNVEW